MKPQPSLTPGQLAQIPQPFQRILLGLQMHDPDVLAYLVSLIMSKIGTVVAITPEDIARVDGAGALGVGINVDPPLLLFTFHSGEANAAAHMDQLAAYRAKEGRVAPIRLNPQDLDKATKQ